MELIITLYQEKADQALAGMYRAMKQYEATQDSDWLEISLAWEGSAYHYLALVEQALEAI